MRCPHCGARTRTGPEICPRCGKRLPTPKGVRRPAVHLYRDRRRRLRVRRILLRCAFAAGLALVLALVILGLSRLSRSKPTPQASPAPTSAPQPTPSPAPSPTPAPPSANVSSREDLIELYWWMIENGVPSAEFASLTASEDVISESVDKFSNYFSAYKFSREPASLTVVFKPGLRVLHAVQRNDVESLSPSDQAVAKRAQAVIAELIRPEMTDIERELAIHDYIVENCEYLLEGGDHAGDARGFFQDKKCICAGYVDIFRLLGRLAGLEIEMIGGPTTRDEPGSKGHAWNLIRLDGLWYVVDATWDDLIETVPTVEHTFFNLPFACFGDSRSWDESCLPPGAFAQALDEKYYYNRADFTALTVEEGVSSAVRQIDAAGRAYLLFPGQNLAREVSLGLMEHYDARGTCEELSQDLELELYRFTP